MGALGEVRLVMTPPVEALHRARAATKDRIADAQGHLARLERQAETARCHLDGLLRELDSFDAAIGTLTAHTAGEGGDRT